MTGSLRLQHEMLKAIYSLTDILQERDDLKEAAAEWSRGLDEPLLCGPLTLSIRAWELLGLRLVEVVVSGIMV